MEIFIQNLSTFLSTHLLLISSVIFFLWIIYKGSHFFRIYDVSQDYTINQPTSSRNSGIRDRVNRNLKSRNSADSSTTFPNCWYAVLESDQVPEGVAQSATVCGKEIVIWREQNGSQLYTSDAHCPHLGAHLGQGKVLKDCIQCPFHHWSYSGKNEGQLTSAPFVKDKPKNIHLKMWETSEAFGFIFVWYSSSGKGPTYEIAIPGKSTSPNYVHKGRIDLRIPCIFNDVAENGMDMLHVSTLHSLFETPESYPDSWNGIIRDVYHPEWANHPEFKHIIETNIIHSFRILDKFDILEATFTSKIVGPSFCFSILDTPLGKIHIFITTTPVEEDVTRLLTRFYAPWYLPQPFVNFILSMHLKEAEKDCRIWSTKAVLKNPALSKDEKALTYFRRFVKQFYSEEICEKVENPDVTFENKM